MSETIADAATAEATEVVDETAETTPVEGADELGDPGKQALDRMKAERNAAKADLRAAKAEAEMLRAEIANKDKPAEEVALTEAEKRGEERATKAANLRIVKSEIKAAAALKLAKAEDALAFINVEDFEVDDNGDVDSDAITEAITNLLKERPYLAAGNQPRFEGGGDGGAKAPAKQNASIDEAIAAAQHARNFPLVATLKQQKAAQKG